MNVKTFLFLFLSAAIVGWWYYEATYQAGYDRCRIDVRRTLEADSKAKEAEAAEAEKSVSPTPSDKIALMTLCQTDENCRERGR